MAFTVLRRRYCAWVLFAGLVLPLHAFQQDATAIQGDWQAVAIERDGRTVTGISAVTRINLTFKGQTVIARGIFDHGEESLSVTLDQKASPKRMDWVRPNGTMVLSLYSLADKQLKLAMPFGSSQERPVELVGKAGVKTIVVTLERR